MEMKLGKLRKKYYLGIFTKLGNFPIFVFVKLFCILPGTLVDPFLRISLFVTQFSVIHSNTK